MHALEALAGSHTVRWCCIQDSEKNLIGTRLPVPGHLGYFRMVQAARLQT